MLLCRVACGQMFRMLRPDQQLVDQVIGTTASAVLGDREAMVGTVGTLVVGWWNNHQEFPQWSFSMTLLLAISCCIEILY